MKKTHDVDIRICKSSWMDWWQIKKKKEKKKKEKKREESSWCSSQCLDCDIVVGEFELQFLYYVHSRTNIPRKDVNSSIPPALG